jgi:hypothetical protein
MKTKTLFLSSLIAIVIIVFLTSTTVDSNGKIGNAGAPGEFTCSQSGCHGAGNGPNASGKTTTGGLPDNGGPGSITITSVPAFVGGNQYKPNTTYSITITVSQTGIDLFGFSFEALDNSGSTNLSVNNAVGVLTITDPTHTRENQPFGTGRNCVTHQLNGGAFPNSANFNFNWTAPASGIVNLYYDGNATNDDGYADAADNVYAHTLQLSPASALGIASVNKQISSVEVFPNPTSDMFTVRFNMNVSNYVDMQLHSADGKTLKTLISKKVVSGMFTQSFSTEGLTKGIYFISINVGGQTETNQIFVN